MSLKSILLVIPETHDTQTTSKTGTSYRESHRFGCRLIGWVAEGRSSNTDNL
jgi:hypothetical protein